MGQQWWAGCLVVVWMGALHAGPPPAWQPMRVLRVVDGDSLWVQGNGQPPLRLRLRGLDAPERCQPHGPQARDALAARLALAGHRVQVRLLQRDSYERWLAQVQLADGDLGAWLVAQGHAWSDGAYRREEQAARGRRDGLFAQAQPERPRDFRRRHGPCDWPGPSSEQGR